MRVEADPAARGDLDAALEALRRRHPMADPAGEGPRAARRARLDVALGAVDELLLAGELAPDGPGRVLLPGFGPATWRALRETGAWAAAVAAGPLADLGDAAPPGLSRPADPALADAARRLLARQAERQDLRDALIRAEASARHAAGRGLQDSLAALERDVGGLQAALDAADADLAALWEAGLRRAAVIIPR